MKEELKQEMPAGAEPLKNDQHEVFCNEYLIDLNIAQAAVRAKYAKGSARQAGHKVFNRPEVQDRINYLKAKRAEYLKIEQIDVLQRIWGIATADPRELVKHKIVNCRHCWGKDHQYQWRDEAEFENALDNAVAEERMIQQVMPNYKAAYPTDDGGYGYRRTKPPHPECPSCYGEGKGYIHIEDTSELSESALYLYAGAKQTKEGVEIKMNDQVAALKLVGQHIGMFKDKVELSGNVNIQPPTFNIVGVKPDGDKDTV